MVEFSGDRGQSEASSLMPRNLPPSFFILGNAPRTSVQSDALKLTYFGDDLDAVRRVSDPAQHLKGLSYLKEIMGAQLARHVAELKVVWIPIAANRGLGGAAGHDTFLTNFAIDAAPNEAARSFVTVLHEQFHQLDGGNNRPQWVSESLAQYYALKAALHVSGRDQRYVALWKQWFAKAAADRGNLLDVQRRVKQGDFSDYKLFYSRGTMFWRDIEAALHKAGVKEGLDPLVPTILDARFGADASLPPDVMKALRVIPEPELRALLAAYL